MNLQSNTLVAIALCALASSAAAQSAWTILPSPNPSPSSNQLYALDAAAPDDVWAVGVHVDPSAGFLSLALHWDGAEWAQVPTPTPAYGYWWKSVAAVGREDVWVIGGHGLPYAFHYDGAGWTTTVLPSPGQFNFGIVVEDVVALASDDVWAVGHYDHTGTAHLRTAVWHWNGAGWSVVPSPSVPNTSGNFYPSVLLSISAVSPTAMFAVGEWRIGNTWFPLALRWNGASWQIQPTPVSAFGDGRLRSVFARAADDVWAVGTANDNTGVIGGGYGRALAMHFDGNAWSVVSTPQPSPRGVNPLRAVVARESKIYAIGSFQNATQGLDTLGARARSEQRLGIRRRTEPELSRQRTRLERAPGRRSGRRPDLDRRLGGRHVQLASPHARRAHGEPMAARTAADATSVTLAERASGSPPSDERERISGKHPRVLQDRKCDGHHTPRTS